MLRSTDHGRRRGYTLVEVLIVVVVLGIAGAMVVPSFSQTGVLRVQGAVRMIVSDITVAQSDAAALQRGRGIVFVDDDADPRYVIAEVRGTALDTDNSRIETRRLGGERFGGVQFETIDLPNSTVVFDALGGPVAAPGSTTPAGTGFVELSGLGQRYRVTIEAYTGRVTVQNVTPTEEPEPDDEDLPPGT